VETIAQTNVQLYNQLRRQNRSVEELELVRRAYDLARSLYSGFFQADGAPFVAHVTGVASIVARLELPGDYVAAACLHNVYTNGDFGDGRRNCATPRRRKTVERAVGRDVEAHVYRFWTLLRKKQPPFQTLTDRVDTLTPEDRQLVVMDLADTLEICHDLGPLYYGDGEDRVGDARRNGPALVGLAEHLGHTALAEMLSSSFSRLLSASIPQSLRPADSQQRFARQEIPRSCMRRPAIAARRRISRLMRRFQKAGSATQH
jgi:(p)ppGpp synthase/HD superfamily hydrolase